MGLFQKIKKVFKTDNEEDEKVYNSEEPIQDLTLKMENDDENLSSNMTNNCDNDDSIHEIIDNNTNLNKEKNKECTPQKRQSKNFTYLQQLIDSGRKEIILEEDILLDEAEEENFSSGLYIKNNDLVINGNGYIIDANKKTRIFTTTGKNILIKNVILQNGIAEEYGAAIYNSGKVTIQNSVFAHNSTENGAVINNERGDITILDCTVENNIVKNNGTIIHNHMDASFIIKNSILKNNITEDGSVIKNEGHDFIVRNNKIINNSSNTNIILNYNGKMLILGSKINNNKSEFTILNDDYLDIEQSIIQYNSSDNIVYNNSESNLSLNGGKLSENITKTNILLNKGKLLNIKNTLIEQNKLEHSSYSSILNKTKLMISNIKINNNKIVNFGEIVISTKGLEKHIENSGIIKYGFYDDNNQFDFTELSKLINISIDKTIILEHDYTFQYYEQNFMEGGIELDVDDLIIDGQNHIIDGKDLSRIFIITGNNIILKNIIFKNGHSFKNYEKSRNSNGGAILINTKGNLTIENCKFSNNNSEQNGGTIENNGFLRIQSSSIINSLAQKVGGGINNGEDGIVEIINSKLEENKAINGGGINNGEDGIVGIINSKLEKNEAITDGGGIYNQGKLRITQLEINKNIAQNGGGIYSFNELEINNCKLSNNVAIEQAGAIYTLHSTLINNSLFKENQSEYNGGAIFNETELIILNSQFLNNLSDYGGAIFNLSQITIKNSLIKNNIAKINGGAITTSKFVGHEQIKLEKTTCIENKPNNIHTITGRDVFSIIDLRERLKHKHIFNRNIKY